MNRETIHVNLGPRSYDIAITSDDRDGLIPFAREHCRGSLAVVVTDVHVLPHGERAGSALEKAGFQVRMITLPAGEAQKCLASAAQLYDQLESLHADRKTLIVAVGGGVI